MKTAVLVLNDPSTRELILKLTMRGGTLDIEYGKDIVVSSAAREFLRVLCTGDQELYEAKNNLVVDNKL